MKRWVRAPDRGEAQKQARKDYCATRILAMTRHLHQHMRVLSLLSLQITVAIFAGGVMAGGHQSTPGQVFRSTTDLVPIDVRVLDRDGKPIADLTAADFLVLEDGVPQTIRHFSAQPFTPATVSTPVKSGDDAGRRPLVEPQNRRIFLIMLGRGYLQRVARGVDGMIHLVRDRLLPQDLVAVSAWNRTTAFTANHPAIAELLERFKNAHENVETKLGIAFSGTAALYGRREIPLGIQKEIDTVFFGATGVAVRPVEPAARRSGARMAADNRDVIESILADMVSESETAALAALRLDELLPARAQTLQDLGNLFMGIEYLRRLAGEKHLVFVSPTGLMLPRAEDDRDLAAAASDARVAIDYVHTSGTTLSVSQSAFGVETRSGSQALRQPQRLPPPALDTWNISTMRTVAELTGGRFYLHQFSNARGAIDDLDQATRVNYLLGYYPSNPKIDGRYRRVTVTVRRPGAKVEYRRGYFARARPDPFDAQRLVTYERIAAAVRHPGEIADIGIQSRAVMAASGPRQELRLDITVDASRLVLVRGDSRHVGAVELVILLLDSARRPLGQTWKTVDLAFTDERLESAKSDGVRIPLTLPVKVPPSVVKIVVYDPAADLLGTRVVDVR